jgi:NADH-quinone oxidoreductase subunit E
VNAPMVMIFKDTYEDLTPERLAYIIDRSMPARTVNAGPQIKRTFSAPEGGLTTLTEEIKAGQKGGAKGLRQGKIAGCHQGAPKAACDGTAKSPAKAKANVKADAKTAATAKRRSPKMSAARKASATAKGNATSAKASRPNPARPQRRNASSDLAKAQNPPSRKRWPRR